MKTDSRPWNGLSTPRSAEGGSALVEPTPHHIACDAIHVTFRADPARIRRFLPPGMESADGTGWVMVGDMVKVSAADPDQYWRNPERSNYNECVLGFNVRFGERTGRFLPMVWVNRDWSMAMGHMMGWAKRLATIERSRLIATHPSILPLGPGACAGGVVIRNGATIIRVKVSLDAASEQLASLPSFGSSTFGYRYLASSGPGVPAVDQLTESTPLNVKTAGIWRGTPWLQFGAGDNEELLQLGDVEVLEGYLYQRGWTLDRNARVVHDYAAAGGV